VNRPLVIGIGNPYRRDDGVGLAVLEGVRSRIGTRADTVEELGEPAALVERWSGREFVIVVDAVVSGAAPGSLVTHELGTSTLTVRPRFTPANSSHALGIAEARELGRVLDRLPQRLLFVGIEAGDTSSGEGLTPEVEAAVAPAIALVLGALG